ncbi:MAG: hypothetical protein AAFO94_09785, partial [Bacteroidota bacterium]
MNWESIILYGFIGVFSSIFALYLARQAGEEVELNEAGMTTLRLHKVYYYMAWVMWLLVLAVAVLAV